MALYRFLLILAFVYGTLTSAWAADHTNITVEDVWARATPPAAEVGAVYFVVSNHGSMTDRLLSVITSIAKQAELHTHIMEGGVMSMRRIEAIELVPGKSVVFQPEGNHVMLIGLHHPLEEGKNFPLTLSFEKAGPIEIQVSVQSIDTTHSGHQIEHATMGHSKKGQSQREDSP